MPKIPLSGNRVSVGASPNTARGSLDSAAAPWRALSRAGEAMRDIGVTINKVDQYKQRKAEALDEATVTDVTNTLDNNWDAAKKTLGSMTDSREQREFYDNWQKEQTEYVNGLMPDLSEKAERRISTRQLDIQERSFTAVNGAGGFIDKADTEYMDRSWIDIQNKALDGKGWENPLTGELMTPEEAYDYSTNKRMELGTVKYEKGEKDKGKFGKTLYFNEHYKGLDLDYQATVDQVDISKMTPENASQWLNHKTEVENKIQYKKSQLEDTTYNELDSESRNKELTLTRLENTYNSEVEIHAGVMGRPLSEAKYESFKMTIAGQVTEDKNSRQYLSLMDAMASGIQKSDITGDEMDTVLRLMGDNGKPYFSAETNLDIMEQVGQAFSVGSKYDPSKRPFNAFAITELQAGQIQKVVDAYEQQVGLDGRHGEMALGSMKGRFGSLFKLYKEEGASLSQEAIDKWDKDNMGKLYLKNAEAQQRAKATGGAPVAPSGEILRTFDGKVAVYNADTKEFVRWQK